MLTTQQLFRVLEFRLLQSCAFIWTPLIAFVGGTGKYTLIGAIWSSRTPLLLLNLAPTYVWPIPQGYIYQLGSGVWLVWPVDHCAPKVVLSSVQQVISAVSSPPRVSCLTWFLSFRGPAVNALYPAHQQQLIDSSITLVVLKCRIPRAAPQRARLVCLLGDHHKV